MHRNSLVAVLVMACGVHGVASDRNRDRDQDGKESRAAPEPLELTIADDWMPVPVFVVPELTLEKPSWKKNAGWAHHGLRVAHHVADGVLEIDLDDGDGYCGAPLKLRLASDARGNATVSVSGSAFSCSSHGVLCDLHGEVHVQRRTEPESALRLTFRIDAMESDLLSPTRTEGALEIPLAPAEWDARIVSPELPTAQAPDASVREVRWLWPDGKLRAHGFVDASGRRRGTWETWYPTGSLQSRTEFVLGERHGVWHTSDEHGCTTDGNVEHGVQQGWWINTATDGSSWRTLYRDGVLQDR